MNQLTSRYMNTTQQGELLKASKYYRNGAPGWVALVGGQPWHFCGATGKQEAQSAVDNANKQPVKEVMRNLSPIREECVEDESQWRTTHKGDLQWVELIPQDVWRRADKMTYTDEGKTEFILSLEHQNGVILRYFDEDFTAAEALGFLHWQSLRTASLLQEMRRDYTETTSESAPRG